MMNCLATSRRLIVFGVLLSATFASAATIAPPKKSHSKSRHVTESPSGAEENGPHEAQQPHGCEH